MKIAFLCTYDFAMPGGVKSHICHLAQELKDQGHEVYIIAPSSQKEVTLLIPNFIQVANFPCTSRTRFIPPHILVKPKIVFHLHKILNAECFDILHIHEPLIPLLCLSALFHKRTPLFATFHTYYEKGQPLYRVFRPILNKCLNRLKGRIVVSNPAKTYIEQYFPYDYKLLPNGIHPNKFSYPLPPPKELTPGYFNILFVGHAQFKRKGLSYLLEAYSTLKKEYPKLRLIIAGTKWAGTSSPTELQLVDTKDILYLGTVSDEKLIALYQSADIFCAPSIGNESFGMVLIEAMAAGIPIVTTKIDGYMSVVRDMQEALLVPPKDSKSLALAIKRLIDDPELRLALITQAKISVQQYSWNTLAKEIIQYYNKQLLNLNSAVEL